MRNIFRYECCFYESIEFGIIRVKYYRIFYDDIKNILKIEPYYYRKNTLFSRNNVVRSS